MGTAGDLPAAQVKGIVSLTLTLRTAAILLLLAVSFQQLVYEQLLVKAIVVAHVLFALSFFSAKQSRRIAVVSIGLAVVVPIGAWLDYTSGQSTAGFFAFNLVVFVYVAYIAWRALRDTP